MKAFFYKFVSTLVALVIIAAVLPAPAHAAPAAQEELPQAENRDPNQVIQARFRQEQRRYERQEKGAQRIERFLERIENRLSGAEERGIDTSAVESALTDFETARAEAAALHAQAGDLIEAHAGFDAQGKATDAETAAQTIEDIHLLNDQARQVLADKSEALQHALWDLFQARFS